MRSLYLLTGAANPQGFSDDQCLYTRLGETYQVEWLDWTQAAGGSLPAKEGHCLIRTPWEYHERPQEFVSYLRNLENQGLRVWNPLDLVIWNMNKNYLLELQSFGITTVASRSGEDYLRESKNSLTDRCVLKPKTGASAFGVKKGSAEEIKKLLTLEKNPFDFLVQDYVPTIETEGESSLIFYCINGKPVYSHAVRKVAKAGEFRIQSEFGGTSAAEVPDPMTVTWAEEILVFMERSLKHDWVYARVDVLYKNGRPLLGELELIEPQLFHRYSAHSVELMVRAIQERCD